MKDEKTFLLIPWTLASVMCWLEFVCFSFPFLFDQWETRQERKERDGDSSQDSIVSVSSSMNVDSTHLKGASGWSSGMEMTIYSTLSFSLFSFFDSSQYLFSLFLLRWSRHERQSRMLHSECSEAPYKSDRHADLITFYPLHSLTYDLEWFHSHFF